MINGEHVKRIKKNSKVSTEEKQVSCQACSILLYTDTKDYVFPIVFNKIKDFCKINDCYYAYICHDNDIYDKNEYDNNYNLIGVKGELKKQHYHIIIDLKQQYEILKLSNEFGIHSRFIKIIKPKDIDNMLLYLTHIKYMGTKTIYSVNQVHGNIAHYVKYLNENYKPSGIISYVIYFVDHNERYITIKEITEEIIKNNLDYSSYRKDFNIIRNIILEHNQFYSNNKLDKYINDKCIELTNNEIQLEKNVNTFGSCYTTLGDTKVMIVKNKESEKK